MFYSLVIGAHPLKMSVANLTYDADKQRYQLDLRMFMDDFLVVTGALEPDANPFGDIISAPSKNSVKTYLADHLFIFFNGAQVQLKVDKIKIEELTIYVTFEVNAEITPPNITEIRVEDTIYVDEFVNQRNMIHISLPGKKKKSLLFNQYQREEVASW
jgi:hypothetical protein